MTAAVTIDPAVLIALRAALALLFASAATHKLRDLRSFEAALSNYELLPRRTTAIAAEVVIGAELSVALSLLALGGSGPALAAAALLGVYTVAIAINLGRGRIIECGCAGPARRQHLSAALLARNGAIIVVVLFCCASAAARPLVWFDAVTVVGAVSFLSLLYGAVDGLLLNAPSLALLRASAAGGGGDE
jgi:uncharacterized membrane protein YphA (DoxX/SURF4 family)